MADPSFVRRIPQGDNLERLVCTSCGFIAYDNPKVVVGSVCGWQSQILLCRRAINPRKGFWTIPAGYLELNETTMDGARREAWEEAYANIEIDALLAVYSIPRLSQVQLIYRARLANADFAPGPETTETRLYGWSDIPWDELAFPSVRWALNHYRESAIDTIVAPRGNPPGETGDTLPGGL